MALGKPICDSKNEAIYYSYKPWPHHHLTLEEDDMNMTNKKCLENPHTVQKWKNITQQVHQNVQVENITRHYYSDHIYVWTINKEKNRKNQTRFCKAAVLLIHHFCIMLIQSSTKVLFLFTVH